jgi:hypothetical protein
VFVFVEDALELELDRAVPLVLVTWLLLLVLQLVLQLVLLLLLQLVPDVVVVHVANTLVGLKDSMAVILKDNVITAVRLKFIT